ncbi:MAG TPA: ABC transporter substrate-binding protein [Solirubrobacteraceae bacterium]|jgi:polar amino acid transport system substrate-binding protein|nr:ABC transporter substrate-binding protein [Solirubrobacteraceae bacterium]
MTRSFSGFPATLAALLAATLFVAACGDSKKDTSTAAGASKAQVAVPAAVKAKGTLVVGSDASYPPMESIDSDGKTVVGMDADLAKALAKVMGLKAKVTNATFDAIIPGIASKKYDLGMSAFTDTKEREATVDFVTYFSAGTSFYAKASGGPAVDGLADLCGLTVAVEKGTTQADDATAQGKKCTKAGKKDVKVDVFRDQNGANLALSSGRANVGMADSPVAAFIVKQSGGRFKLIGTPYGTAPYGIAMPKDGGLAKPILAAMKALIADGTYQKLLDKYGLASGAIKTPAINGAIS